MSIGFFRTISTEEVCFSTGFVSLIGCGEADLEPGAWLWDSETNRGEREMMVCVTREQRQRDK